MHTWTEVDNCRRPNRWEAFFALEFTWRRKPLWQSPRTSEIDCLELLDQNSHSYFFVRKRDRNQQHQKKVNKASTFSSLLFPSWFFFSQKFLSLSWKNRHQERKKTSDEIKKFFFFLVTILFDIVVTNTFYKSINFLPRKISCLLSAFSFNVAISQQLFPTSQLLSC